MNHSLQSKDRQIRVFISSTFRDMQEERDILIKKIFPQLRKQCEERAVTWTEVDLRWGITDEQKAEGKVLPLCLEEIHRCRPYFIGLLGERYGWVPDSIPAELLESQPWLKQHLQHSVTELEILHGVFSEEQLHWHAYFYFRDPKYVESVPEEKRQDFTAENPESAEKLRKLKQKIWAARDEQVCRLREDYANPEQLGEWILEDFTKLIDRLYPKEDIPDALDQEAARHEAYAQNRRLAFIGREELLRRLDEYASTSGKPLVLTGESGCGKSALLAEWVARWRKDHPDDLIIQHYIGSTPDSANWQGLVRRILDEFKRAFAITDDIPLQPDALRNALNGWAVKAAGSRRVVLVLDALNQLADDGAALQLGWLPVVFPTNFRVLISSLPGESLDALRKRGWPELNVPLFTRADIAPAALAYFKIFSKTPPQDIVAILESAPTACNALYLRAVLDELRQFGQHEELKAKAADYLSARDPKELYHRILARWEQDFGEDLVRHSLSLISAARRGLSESELADLLGKNGEPLPSAKWTPFYLAAEASLTQYAGLLTFSHGHLRDAVCSAYVPSKDGCHRIHLQIADYFEGHILQGSRQVAEITWQLAQAEHWERLYSKLADLGFLFVLYAAYPIDVMRYWAQLEAHSSHEAVTAYQALLASPDSYEPSVVMLVASLLVLGHPAHSLRLFEYLGACYRQAGKHKELQTCLWSQAMLHHRQGGLDTALTLLKEYDQLCIETNDRRELAASLGLQAQILRDRGELDAAMTVLNEGEKICRDLNEDYLLALVLGTQGTILQIRGDLDAALMRHKEQEDICRRLGSWDLYTTLGNQAAIHHRRGDLDSAMLLYKQEEEICRELGDKAGLAASLGGQAMILREKCDFEGAIALHKQEERLFRELGHKRGVVASLANQAQLARKRGDVAKVITLTYEKGGLLAELGDAKGMIEAVIEVAGSLQSIGDLDNAMIMHQQLEKMCRDLGHLDGLQYSLRNQGLILQTRGDLDGALRRQKEAEVVCRELGNAEQLGSCLANQALVLTQQGQIQQAKALADQARQLALRYKNQSLLRQVDLLLAFLSKS